MKTKILAVVLLVSIVLSAFGTTTLARSNPQIGDHNGDGKIDANDAIFLLYHVFFPEDFTLADKDSGGSSTTPETYDDSDVINAETLTSYCNTNEKFIPENTKVKAIIVELPGLGGSSCLGGSVNMGDYATAFTYHCAENGIVVAYMFPGPWAWGNKAEVRMTDAVVDALAKKYELGDDYPLIVCGGSMGGLGSLIYAADTSHKSQLAGVMSACPCVDVLDRFNASASYPRSFVSAVASYDMPLTDALKTISPVERIADMPDVPYFICSDGDDEVFPEAQCDSYVDKLKKAGLDVTYRQQAGLKHGFFNDTVKTELERFMLELGLDGEKEINPPSGPSEDDLTIKSVEKISSTQLKITFSEPVVRTGSIFFGIRYTGSNGVGVLRKTISGEENTVMQFTGSIAAQSSTVWIFTLGTQSAPLNSITTLDQILNKEGVLYGIECPVKFCIEEVSKDGAGKSVNNHVGKIDNIYAASDITKFLNASQTAGPTSWEGVYVDIVETK